MQGKITKRVVDSLKIAPGNQSGEAVLWDDEVQGFGVRLRAGGTKTYLVHYRVRGGRNAPLRKYTIGRHGSPWTADEARAEAKRILGLVEAGADPAASKAAHRGAINVASLAARFLAEHVEPKCKPRTAIEYRRLIDKIILPKLGKKLATDVVRGDIAKLHHAYRDTLYDANRTLAVLSKMFTLAEKWGERPDGSNPCRHVEKYQEHKRERMLSAEELGNLGKTLVAAEQGKIKARDKKTGKETERLLVFTPHVIAAIRLLVFTGARLREVLGLRWEWIDFERGEARLPDSKTGAKTLHFPPPALEVLKSLPRVDGNPHVIIGGVPGACLVNLEKPWLAIREAAGLGDVRLHDLRHAFASVAAASGMGLPIIGKMLGHTQAQTTQRYAHLASDPVKAAAASVAGKISAAMQGTSATVVNMPKRTA